jgi:hypothetical protein
MALYTFSENRMWVRLQYGSSATNGALGGGSGEAQAMSVINTDQFNIPTPGH